MPDNDRPKHGRRIDGMIDGPDHRHSEAGLAVILKSIPGLTAKGLLRRPYTFQIPPLDEFGWDASYNWIDYGTISAGTFTRDGGRQLRTVSFNSLVVDYNPRWAVVAGGNHHHPDREPGGPAPNPRTVADDLDRLLAKGTPLRLRAWNRHLHNRPDLDLFVTIRSLSVRERGGEPDARYFDMSFTEYRDPSLRRKGAGKGHGKKQHDLPAVLRINRRGIAEEVETSGDNIPEKKRHEIGTADKPATLRKLAKHFYGKQSSRWWKLIAAKNGITGLGGDASLAQVVKKGRPYRKLQIPRAPEGWWDVTDTPDLSNG